MLADWTRVEYFHEGLGAEKPSRMDVCLRLRMRVGRTERNYFRLSCLAVFVAVPLTQVRSDLGLSHIAGNAVIAQNAPRGESPADEQQRLHTAQTSVGDVIAKYRNRMMLPHVAEVHAAYQPDKGYIIAVFADSNEYVVSVERAEPSALDGYPVIVFPPNTGEEQ